MIIYIHGYNSSGEGQTAKDIKKIFPNTVCPSYDPLDPCESLKSLLSIVDSAEDEEDIIIVASSLGAWYAEKIASVRSVDLVLYNPSIRPAESLKKYGIDEKILDMYQILSCPDVRPGVRRYVVLSEDDDVVNPWITKDIYRNVCSVVLTDGGHRMTEKNLGIVSDKVEYLLNSF